MLAALFRLLSKLPLPLLHALGSLLGWMVYVITPSYRRRLKDNIARAGYAHYLHAAVKEAGKNILELAFVWYAPSHRILRSATIAHWEIVQTALDAGRGIIFLTPHLGCFEILAHATATRMPLTVLYRPPRKAALKPLMEGARARHNLTLAPANLSGVRTLLKVLRNNGAIGLLPDQVPQHGEGVWADFFGRPAYTMTLSAKLQNMTDAPIVLAYAERLPHGRGYVLHFVRFEQNLIGAAEEQARIINAAMEQLITRCPAQYFWSYHRYKTPPGVTRPAAGHKENA